MNIIIVGDGKVGSSLAGQFAKEGHDVTIVDSNPKVLTSHKVDILNS